jgi:hypothetical protein
MQIVKAVVARAPDLVGVALVLNGATQMGAYGGNRSILTFGGKQKQSRPAAERKDFRAVGLKVAHLAGHNFIATQIGNGWRHKIAEHRIKKRSDGSDDAATQDQFNKPASRRRSRRMCTRWPQDSTFPICIDSHRRGSMFGERADVGDQLIDLIFGELSFIGGHFVLALGDDAFQGCIVEFLYLV